MYTFEILITSFTGNEKKGPQNIDEAFEYTSCTSNNDLGSCNCTPNPKEASLKEFKNEGYPSSEVNSLDQAKPNNANIDIINHSKEQQNNTIKEAGEIGLPDSDSLSSHDTLSDNLKQNQFSLSMQTQNYFTTHIMKLPVLSCQQSISTFGINDQASYKMYSLD